MGYGKWITGALGWALGGPIGGIIGFAVASIFEGKEGSAISTGYTPIEQRNSFLVSLLVLSSAVMKADNRVMKSELDYVKRFISENFGIDAATESSSLLKDFLKQEVDIDAVCAQVRRNVNAPTRLQLLHFLTGIAQADGMVSSDELTVLRRIAAALAIPLQDSESIFAMFDKGIDAAYQVLEIDKNVTDDEVKKAFKRMALKHHPDKVTHLGPDVQKAAEEKFKSVAEAYEKIKKERGIV
ncbi:MAG TPA: TerB family tellurite resistance protein [Bacteroidales bacterium]|nr:TerB family tellurite resistance protein [Bacteroidales bacterium]HNW49060.1 TerB family tellurite resistance protein [Bacteroidales bacterium]HPS94955.1 TerB family tellurite resistance protein [Bacteroidales bacterium]